MAVPRWLPVLFLVSLAAQQPVADTKNTSTVLHVLLAAVPTLDETTVRRAATRAFGVDLQRDQRDPNRFVVTDDAGDHEHAPQTGQRIRVHARFVLNSGAGLHVLSVLEPARGPEWELRSHLESDARVADAMRQHAAYISIITGGVPEQADANLRHALQLALELFDEPARAIALEDSHYVALDETTRAALRGDAPRELFAPRQEVAILWTTAAAPVVSRDMLTAAVRTAFGVERLGSGPPADAWLFVGSAGAAMRVEGVRIAIRSGAGARIEPQPGDPDEARRAALERQQGWIRIGTTGTWDTAKARRSAYVPLARLAAALLDATALTISFREDASLHLIDSGSRQALLSEDPVAAFAGRPPLVTVADEDPEMTAAIAQAQQSWPRFVELFRAGGDVAIVKWAAREGDAVEHLWVTVTAIEQDQVTGIVENEPHAFRTIRLKQKVRFPRTEVSDWLWRRGERTEGGFTLEVVERRARGK